ncbi:MAG TPA: hypothetical protein VKT77_05225 [Chthonomonadaceae bacterium]|nr:hypothetical protein [Chthonomonadaceae bacterium]
MALWDPASLQYVYEGALEEGVQNVNAGSHVPDRRDHGLYKAETAGRAKR